MLVAILKRIVITVMRGTQGDSSSAGCPDQQTELTSLPPAPLARAPQGRA